MEKLTVAEFKKEVYKEFTEEINLISKNSVEVRPEGEHKADIGVATDMFLSYIENTTEKSIFINVLKAKEKIAELRSRISE